MGNIVRCVLLNNCLSWNMMKPSSTPKANLGDITSTSWEWTPFQLNFQTVALLAQVGLEGQCLYNYPDRQSWGLVDDIYGDLRRFSRSWTSCVIFIVACFERSFVLSMIELLCTCFPFKCFCNTSPLLSVIHLD